MKCKQYGHSVTMHSLTHMPGYSQKIRFNIIEDATAAMMVIMTKATPDAGVKKA